MRVFFSLPDQLLAPGSHRISIALAGFTASREHLISEENFWLLYHRKAGLSNPPFRGGAACQASPGQVSTLDLQRSLLPHFCMKARPSPPYLQHLCCCLDKTLNSLDTKITDTTKAIKSAMGPASSTPKMPKRRGSKKIRGIRKKTCRVKESSKPLSAFPMAVKKLEESSCTPLTSTMKRKVRINRIANSK